MGLMGQVCLGLGGNVKKYFEIELPELYANLAADDIYDYLTNTAFTDNAGLVVKEIVMPPSMLDIFTELNKINKKLKDIQCNMPGSSYT